jgi:hypothetical protein
MKNKMLVASLIIVIVTLVGGSYYFLQHEKSESAEPVIKNASTKELHTSKNSTEQSTPSTSPSALATSSGQIVSEPTSPFIGKWKKASEKNKSNYDEFLIQDGKKLFYAYSDGKKESCVWNEQQDEPSSSPDKNTAVVECHWDPKTESYSYTLFITYDPAKDIISITDEGDPVLEERVS